MRIKNAGISILFFVILSSILPAYARYESLFQKAKENKLEQKYKAFLIENQSVMTFEEKELFLGLTTNEDRDRFMDSFRKIQRRKGIRANITTLMLLRMVQVLHLTEDQTAKILPKINQNENEKWEIQRQIGRRFRELNTILNEDNPDEKKLSEKVEEIKSLRNDLKAKEEDLEKFFEENLTLVQRARYFVFMQEFYGSLRQKLDRARRNIERFRISQKR